MLWYVLVPEIVLFSVLCTPSIRYIPITSLTSDPVRSHFPEVKSSILPLPFGRKLNTSGILPSLAIITYAFPSNSLESSPPFQFWGVLAQAYPNTTNAARVPTAIICGSHFFLIFFSISNSFV